MNRQYAHNSCLSRDCKCVNGADRDSNYHSVIDEVFDHFEQLIEDLTDKQCSKCTYWTHDVNGDIDPNLMFGECDFFGIQGMFFYCSNYEPKEDK